MDEFKTRKGRIRNEDVGDNLRDAPNEDKMRKQLKIVRPRIYLRPIDAVRERSDTVQTTKKGLRH